MRIGNDFNIELDCQRVVVYRIIKIENETSLMIDYSPWRAEKQFGDEISRKEYTRTTQSTTLNEGVNEGVNGGVNEGDTHIDAINQIEGVSDTTKIELAKILRLFHDNEGLKLKDIALRIDRPAKTIERYLRILKDLSIIEFRGAPRSGKYYVVEL